MTKLLSTEQMAEFANSGCLFFEGLIDEDLINKYKNLMLNEIKKLF